jgi:NAD(P)-dependent dehydrogenase (short-subunit alcohol dehydrogenase family)
MTDEVLVVIGTGGMGEAIARRSGSGRTVLLADFKQELLDRLESQLGADGFDVRTQLVDVSSRDSVEALATAAADLGPVTQVVHTAGLSPAQAPVRSIIDVDLLGVAYAVEAFGRIVAPGGAGVIIASMAGATAQLDAATEHALATTQTDELAALPALAPDRIDGPGAAYALSKRANQVLMYRAAGLWGARGARINTISPGPIATPMGAQELATAKGDQMKKLADLSAAGRMGTSSDIANATAFLLGPDAAYITGTDLLVDGGATAGLRAGSITIG